MKKITLVLAALLCLLGLCGCGSSEGTTGGSTSVSNEEERKQEYLEAIKIILEDTLYTGIEDLRYASKLDLDSSTYEVGEVEETDDGLVIYGNVMLRDKYGEIYWPDSSDWRLYFEVTISLNTGDASLEWVDG